MNTVCINSMISMHCMILNDNNTYLYHHVIDYNMNCKTCWNGLDDEEESWNRSLCRNCINDEK